MPAILFIPGYVLIFTFFPNKKKTQGIDIIERIALSFGLSIAIVPLIGLGLNYTPWGIRLLPILSSLVYFICLMGLVAIYRWYTTPSDERFTISTTINFSGGESRLDKALTAILAISILISIIVLVYVIVLPKSGEKFTEFYILGKDGIADDYPRNLSRNGNANVRVGIVNHEYSQMNYTLELWAINQSQVFNVSNMKNETIYHHMWFVDSIEITLDHMPIDIQDSWAPQWEQNLSFSLNHTGMYKFCFMLYTSTQDKYSHSIDYVDIVDEKLNSVYRELHLWIHVSD